jgi:hypothetical protein
LQSRAAELVKVAVTKYGDGPLPADQVQIASDGTVVEVSCIRYAEAPAEE